MVALLLLIGRDRVGSQRIGTILRVHAARGDMKNWWTMFKDTVGGPYDDEVELAIRISGYV